MLSKTDVYNKTLIPVTTGKVATANVTHNATLTVAENANLQSARHMYLRADKGDLNVRGDGFHQFLLFILVPITVSEDFGSASVSGSGTVAINGNVETGVFNEQFIGFGRDFGTFAANTMTADAYDATRQNLIYNTATGLWDRRTVDNASLIETIQIANMNAVQSNANLTYKSDDEVKWTFDVGRSLSQDIDDEIANLITQLGRTFDNSSAGGRINSPK